ncbi:MAG: hypothetical protein EWV61_14265 [Microcystis aeruginosa Ma_AC_P_19900807_S300]|nr:MAG: hypothetical protein EWV61_14265 [Microcystis aeruginosa Ma_AC_P_19900807_S300]
MVAFDTFAGGSVYASAISLWCWVGVLLYLATREGDRTTRNFNNGMGKDARVYLDSIETLLKRLIFIMGWRNSLLLTLLILVVGIGLGAITGGPIMRGIVFWTALWAAIDSHTIEIHKYKITGSFVPSFGNSWSVFLFLLILWVYCFPAYLIIRGKILRLFGLC